MNNIEIIIGLDESNKSSLYGNYVFSIVMLSNQQIKQIKNSGYAVGDSKKVMIFDSLNLYNYLYKNYRKHWSSFSLSPAKFDKLMTTYNLNLNDLTMVMHLLLIEQLCQKQINFLRIRYKIIIDDFMDKKNNKEEYVYESIQKLQSIVSDDEFLDFGIKEIKHLPHIFKANKIFFAKNGDSIYENVAIASQISYIKHLRNFKTISKRTDIPIATLKRDKNNYIQLMSLLLLSKKTSLVSFFNNYVRAAYPKKTLINITSSPDWSKVNKKELDKRFDLWDNKF